MAEWSNALAWKAGKGNSFKGSNPFLSAIIKMEYIDSKYFSYADPDDPYLKRLIIRTIESLSGQPELYKLYNEYQRSPELYRNFWEGSVKKLNLNVIFLRKL